MKGLIMTINSPEDQIKVSNNLEAWYRKELVEKCFTYGTKTKYLNQLFPERIRSEVTDISTTEDFQEFWAKLKDKLED